MTEMQIPWPADATHFEVRCLLGLANIDGVDTDRYMDLQAQGGKITFDAPGVPNIMIREGGRTRWVALQGYEYTIRPTDGELVSPDGLVGLALPRTDAASMLPKSFLYRAVVTPNVGQKWEVKFNHVSIDPTLGFVDLAAVKDPDPVASGDPQIVARMTAAENRITVLETSGGSGSGGALTPIAADTTTEAGTTTGQLVGYLNTSAAAIAVNGVSLAAESYAVFYWTGTTWVQAVGSAGAAPDVVAPAWSATLTTGTPTDTSVVIAASALATDNIAVTGYRWRLTGEATTVARAITPSGLDFTLDGLTASTSYAAPILWAVDAAGNKSAELTAQAFITATPPPSWKTVFYDTFTGAANTDLLAHTPDIGAAWTYTKTAGTNKIIINAAGQAQAQWADTNYNAPRGKILTDNADLKLRITLDYVLASATANCHVSGFAFDNSATPLTAGAYVDGTGAIYLDGHVLTATETSGLTSLAPLSGTMVITLDGTGTIAADGTSNVSITLEINGALYRRWTNVDWNGTGSVATGQYIAGAQVSFGGGNVHAGSPLGSTLVDNVRIEKWA